MTKDRQVVCRLRAQMLKALAHPARMCVVELLADGERCVCELAALSNCGMSALSKHLSALKNMGILGSRRDKNRIFYRLNCDCLPQFLQCMDSLAGASLAEKVCAAKLLRRRINR
jgi:ArsR family transcriptional regulator